MTVDLEDQTQLTITAVEFDWR